MAHAAAPKYAATEPNRGKSVGEIHNLITQDCDVASFQTEGPSLQSACSVEHIRFSYATMTSLAFRVSFLTHDFLFCIDLSGVNNVELFPRVDIRMNHKDGSDVKRDAN